MKYLLLSLSAVIIFSGCARKAPNEISNNLNRNELSIWSNFSLQAPFTPKKKYMRDDGSIAWLSYQDDSARRQNGDIAIELYEKKESCNGNLLGVWHPKNWEGDVKAIWGKNDFFEGEIPDFPDGIEPLCVPFVNGSAYGFCAEKDGISVMICIAQMSEGSQTAEDIFKTFKWTK